MRRTRIALFVVVALVVVTVVAVVATRASRHGSETMKREATSGPAVGLTGHHAPAGSRSWAPWPQALHDAQHSGASPFSGPRTAHLRWSRRLEGDVTPGPVVARDGTILAASNAGVLHAVDPATGRDRWTVDGGAPYGLDLSTSAAVLPDGLVVWPGPDGTLFGISEQGRRLWKWRSPSGDQLTSPAVTSGGDVVVGDVGGHLAALRPTADGPGVQWRVTVGTTSYGSAVWSEDGRTAYQTVTSGIVAVRGGKVLWRSTAPTEIVEVSPAVAPDGTVVVGTNDPYEYGLDPTDGSVRWRHRRGFLTYSSPGVTRDGIAYFGDHHNRIEGVDATDGRELFSFVGSQRDVNPGGIGIWTSVLVDARHTVYAGTRQGLVYAVDRTGRRLWQRSTGVTVDSYPALTADGVLVIGTTDGRLLAIGPDAR